jgi:fatty-acid desaturase
VADPLACVQGDPLEWVSSHRYHHQYCDTEMDPHTPYEGFWHSHMGWLLDEQPTNQKVSSNGMGSTCCNLVFPNVLLPIPFLLLISHGASSCCKHSDVLYT